jgi:MFS family permease
LVVSHLLAACAMGGPWPGLLALVWHETHSDLALGLAGGARLAPYVLLSWLAGAVGDRYPRIRVIAISTTVRLILLVGSAAAVLAGQVWVSVALAVLTVCAGTPAYPTAVALIADLHTDPRRRDRHTQWLVTAEVSAFVVGPALGGVVLGVAGPTTAVYASAVATAVAAVLLVGLRPRVHRERVRYADQVRTVGVGLLALATQRWHGGDHEFGWLTAAFGFGAVGAPLLGLLRFPPTAVRRWLVVLAVTVAAVGLAGQWWWALPPLLVFGAVATRVEVSVTALIQTDVPARSCACALGVADSAMIAAGMIGAALAPTLVRWGGAGGFVAVLLAVIAAVLGVVRPAPVTTTSAVVEGAP